MRIKQDRTKLSLVPSANSVPFIVQISSYNVQTNPTIDSENAIYDAIFSVTISATYHKEGRVEVLSALNSTLENLTPDICEMSESGELTRISEGVARIAAMDRGVTKHVVLDMSDRGSASVQIFNRVVSSSLMAHCIDQIDNRINGLVKSTNCPLYSSQNHTTKTFVRNPNCWLTLGDQPVNLTAISPSNSRSNQLRAGTLITPRHVLNAAHYPLYNGDKIYFVSQDGNNTTIERTIVGSASHPNYVPYLPDLRVYTLDSDVPNSITPCKTLPSDYTNYIVNTRFGRPPTIGLDQEELALVQDMSVLSNVITHTIPIEENRLNFFETKIGGDSGNPCFFIINNTLVLLTCWTNGNAGSGTSVPYYQNDINTLMIPAADAQAGVDTGYIIDTVDLSTFPSYE